MCDIGMKTVLLIWISGPKNLQLYEITCIKGRIAIPHITWNKML